MEEELRKATVKIFSSNVINSELKNLVATIVRGYLRVTNFSIDIDCVDRVANCKFIEVKDKDKFLTENNILGMATTIYNEDGTLENKIEYTTHPDSRRDVCILMHEIGHIITNCEPTNIVKKDGKVIFPILKMTNQINFNCEYENGELVCDKYVGYRMSDGFIESACTRMLEDPKFRIELYQLGYDFGDYYYKDERLFPSRIYDEYKSCFELFSYILRSQLTYFSCSTYSSNEILLEEYNRLKLGTIYDVIDKSNDALWELKKYEGKEADDEYYKLLDDYKKKKETSIALAKILPEYLHIPKDDRYRELLEAYEKSFDKQILLPKDKRIRNI